MNNRVKRLLTTFIAAGFALAVCGVARAAPTTFHVADDGGNDGNDGLSWSSPFKTIGHALTQADDGDSVLVTNGVYSISSQIAVTNGVSVSSVNGAEVTIVQRASGDFRLVRLAHADALFEGFTITGSTRGGVEIAGAGTLSDCIVRDNISGNNTTSGGGVHLNGGGVVRRCRIVNNRLTTSGGAGGSGGGVLMTGAASLVETSIITNNWIGTGEGNSPGGGVHMTGGILRNSLIARNFSRFGVGGVYCTGGTIESCTIVENHTPAVLHVGGAHIVNGQVLNSIIVFNTHVNGIRNYVNTGVNTVYSYSCTTPAMPGVGNIDHDVLFVDRAAQDYRLRAGPCVDGGLYQDWMGDAEDVAGNPRIVSDAVDMGALELVPGALLAAFEGIPTEGIASNQVVFTAYASGTNTAGLYYAWSFNNDETTDVAGLDRQAVTNLYWTGLYSVRLTVSNAIDETATVIRPDYIKVAPATAYVTTNGASLYPYDTWAHAATNIQDALDAGLEGTLVLVSNGVYNITRQIEMPRNIVLRSVNGADSTSIRRAGGTIRIFYISAPDAVVDGFTIADATDVAVFLDRGGIVSNSVIRDAVIGGSGGFGGGVRMDSGGWLKNCAIINNRRNSTGGGAAQGHGVYMTTGALVENCVIAFNNSGTGYGTGGWSGGGGIWMSGGTLRNSLIFGNQHHRAGGGVRLNGGIIENCTIVTNTSGLAGGGIWMTGGTVRNAIAYFNTVNTDDDNLVKTGGTITYSCVTPLPAGEGNIDDNPLFKNEATGNWRLTDGSPCLNKGLNLAWMDDAVDLDGNPRINNDIVDMGAYELPPPLGTLFFLR